MKSMTKTSMFFTVALLITTFVFTGAILAAEPSCPTGCTASIITKKGTITVDLATLPDNNGNWPVVVNEPGTYSCDDPGLGVTDNYPCLAWPYQCTSEGTCQNLNKATILISKCCNKPIEILWTSHGSPIADTFQCTEGVYPDNCSGFQLRLPNNSGSNTGMVFWFTTPTDVGTDLIDIMASLKDGDVPCLAGIQGPGCSSPTETVRIEPVDQCFEFSADGDCHNSSTWLLRWRDPMKPCSVDVWAAYDEYDAEGNLTKDWNCSNVYDPNNSSTNHIQAQSFSQAGFQVAGENVTSAKLWDVTCGLEWLRTLASESDPCNYRIVRVGDKIYILP